MDPTVTPSAASEAGAEPKRQSRRQRRAQRAELDGRAAATDGAESPANESNTLRNLRKLLKKKDTGTSETSWSSTKGPEKGVRWRGGAPPPPPKWHYAKDDLRAFSKFERKVSLWQLQIKPYMSDKEAALTLYTSLGGEAEEELEHIDIKRLYSKDGISFLLDQLRGPLQAKQIYLKRKYLSDYEVISRTAGESMRAYVNRYHRVEKSLLSIGIDVGLTYDSESRGSRLLDRAKLSHEQQRMILVGTSQSLNFDDIKSALVLQYPDHKPTPFLQGLGQRDNTYPEKGKAGTKGDGKGKAQKANGYGQPARAPSGQASSAPYRRRYVADHGDGEELEQDDPYEALQAIKEDDDNEPDDANCDDNQDGGDDELIPDDSGDPTDAIEELVQVLTATSKKLQSMTQGRKYRGAPQRSVADRKKTSACAACGQVGHWAGDPECPASAKGKGKGKADDGKNAKGPPNASPADRKNSSGVQKVFSVRHATGAETLYSFDAMPNNDLTGQDPPSSRVHRTLAVFQAELTCLANVTELQGYCVVDTACQRSCCSRQWSESQRELLESFGLAMLFSNRREAFQFGAGEPQRSGICAHIPVAFDGSYPMIALCVSILENLSIPFLASLSLLKKLHLVLDLAQQKAHIGLLGCCVDLHLLQGHLCLKISEYPACVGTFSWEELNHHDCEFLCNGSLLEQNSLVQPSNPAQSPTISWSGRDARDPSVMACGLEKDFDQHAQDVCPGGRVGLPGESSGRPGESHKDPRRCQAGGPQQGEASTGDAGGTAALPPRRHEAPWKQHGKVRDVQQVPSSVEVGRGWRGPWMALSSIFQILCATLAFGPDGAGHVMDPSRTMDNGLLLDRSSGSVPQDETTADFSNVGVRVPWDTGRGDRGEHDRGRVRLGPGDGLLSWPAGPGPRPAQPKEGATKRMVHNVGRTLHILGQEVAIYNERPGDYEARSGADLLEAFWEDRFAKTGVQYNLVNGAGDYDLSYVNFDQEALNQNSEVLGMICDQVKPYVLMVHNMQRLSAMNKQIVKRCCEAQAKGGRLFIVDFDNQMHEDHTGAMM